MSFRRLTIWARAKRPNPSDSETCPLTTTRSIMTLPTASNNSSSKGSSLPASSIVDQSRMSAPRMSGASHNATGSPASEVGPTLFYWLDGQMNVQHGQALALASPSLSPEKAPASLTSATCGQSGSTSSASAALQSSLVSRLQAHPFGSIDYTMTWKVRILPSGRRTCRLAASARSTVGLDSGLLPTPSGTSNHGKNHVAGRLDEWGGSSNPFRGTNLGKVHCPAFEFWVMGYGEAWQRLMQPETPSSPKSPRRSSKPRCDLPSGMGT